MNAFIDIDLDSDWVHLPPVGKWEPPQPQNSNITMPYLNETLGVVLKDEHGINLIGKVRVIDIAPLSSMGDRTSPMHDRVAKEDGGDSFRIYQDAEFSSPIDFPPHTSQEGFMCKIQWLERHNPVSVKIYGKFPIVEVVK